MRYCERIARCPIDFIPLAATTLLLRRLEPRKIRYRNSERQYLVSYGLLGNRKILEGIDDLRPDSSVIPDEKRGPVDSQQSWQGRLSASVAYASLACSVACWLALGLYYLLGGLHMSPPEWRWVVSLPGWKWTLFEPFGLLLAIIATVLRARLWPIALPVAFLTFLLTYYTAVS